MKFEQTKDNWSWAKTNISFVTKIIETVKNYWFIAYK